MDSECKKIEQIVGLPHVGGKLFCRDSSTAILMDVDMLSNKSLHDLQKGLPHLNLDVVSNEQSVSGFIIVFTRAETGVQVTVNVVHIMLNLGLLALTMSKLF